MIRISRNHFKARDFFGPHCYSQATDYAKQWSLNTELPICIWECAKPDSGTGPFFVASWKDPWPNDAIRIVCAYDQGRNNADLIYVLDDFNIKSRTPS